ncbi:MAG: hypothetical protein Q7T39_21990 [Polaromonas sp.]|jgi:hypothetical protein|nr:hypothetical protein [Polaromonas sp.]
MNPHPVRDATTELLWAFFPVLIVVFVLFLLGRTDNLLHRTDLILVASVLFAEGWARTRRIPRRDRGFYSSSGFFGSMVTIAIAVLMLVHEVDGQSLSKIVETGRFAFFHYVMLLLSVLYGWFVRIRVNMNIFPHNSQF